MKINTLPIIICLLLLISQQGPAQSWQWAKKGGTVDDTDNGNSLWEQVRAVVTDSQDNVYILANVGIQNLYGGWPRPAYLQ